MKVYSHRGNLNGPCPKYENDPDYVKEAMKEKFAVEVDVYGDYNDYSLAFGHDGPEYPVTMDFVNQYKYRLILHCKNFDALRILRNRDFHHFYHVDDPYTITSWNWTWMYPSKDLPYDTLTVMAIPECANWTPETLTDIGGVCTDWPLKWGKGEFSTGIE